LAAGGMFSKFSHEFQTLTDAGEDIIYLDKGSKEAVNKEIWNDPISKDLLKTLGRDASSMKEEKSVEVGNIFTLGTRFSEALGLEYTNESGEKKAVFMGSYGIGPGRVMGTIVEILSDEKGIVWPVSVAPFKVHLIEITSEKTEVKKAAEDLYTKLAENGIEVLYDDREMRAGEKFGDSDLIGIPLRIVISEKGIAIGEFEVKERKNGNISMLAESALFDFIKKY
jgi:prolyl-tRNA synthetase